MSYADTVYKSTLKEIIENGAWTSDFNTRTEWADTNEKAHTKKITLVTNRYNPGLEFPAITLRTLAFKSAVNEMLWIYQKKSNVVSELGSKIWDQWVKDDGTIGHAYGWQVGNKLYKVNTTLNKILAINPYWFETKNGKIAFDNIKSKINSSSSNQPYDVANKDMGMYECINAINEKLEEIGVYYLDQMDYVLHELKYNPMSRRIMISLWDIDDLPEMALEPCCNRLEFNVRKVDGKMYLDMKLDQRSWDTVVAGPWNIAQYATLHCILAKLNNYEVGNMLHVITDAHIYDRHIDIAKELISREGHPAPKLVLDFEEGCSFYDITIDDIKLEGYTSNAQITNIPVAK